MPGSSNLFFGESCPDELLLMSTPAAWDAARDESLKLDPALDEPSMISWGAALDLLLR